MTRLRPAQRQILRYRRGKMGIAAVPGSGKTWTLSRLAAQIVTSGKLADDQEVLVVTLVNSAVENFYQRVSAFVDEKRLLPYMGYRVRTLHGLAHDIVRARPGLVGLEDNFNIVDEREAEEILKDAARAWLRTHPYDLDDYLSANLEDARRDWVRREQLPDLVTNMARSLIGYAKDQRLLPERLQARLDALPLPLPLAQMGCDIYADYQRGLAYRAAVDFNDLIRLALQALESDPEYLERLRHGWPYILEDEAQDSSRLQEEILALLAGPQGNWVRVGDPNQAIYETFTTANPRYLREFLARPDVTRRELPNSGRSAQTIIDLANALVDWTMNEHVVEGARNALQAPPYIQPTPPDDPQPNPPGDWDGIRISLRRFTPAEEIAAVVDSLARWLPEHPDQTVAVLSPRNERGIELAEALRQRGLPFDDSLLKSTSATRLAAGVLVNALRYLADPSSARKLSRLFEVWRRADRDDPATRAAVEALAERVRKLNHVEDYLWPGADADWLADLEVQAELPQPALDWLAQFRTLVRRWQGATLLPVDQQVLTLAQDLLTQPGELALAHKLALLMRQVSGAHSDWRLPELSEELAVIAKNERRFIGFSSDDLGFDPDQHKGTVVLATMHRAKGLEWDRVYLMSVNNYDFPSALPEDTFMSERWYLRDGLNLEAEALGQLEAALSVDQYAWYEEGQATAAARLDYARERLRLLYVGITRARRELVLTHNSGRSLQSQAPKVPALPLAALYDYWEGRKPDVA